MGDAHRWRRFYVKPVDIDRLIESVEQLLSNKGGIDHGNLWKQDNKFIATQSGTMIRFPATLTNSGCISLQNLIADIVAIGVIDLFEMVNIQIDQSTLMFRNGRQKERSVPDGP